jgi:glucose/arabinose dehydrogenase
MGQRARGQRQLKLFLGLTAWALLAITAPVAAQTGAAPTITVPPGFHLEVVHEGIGPARHLAIRANGDIYVSTRAVAGKPESGGVFALRDTNGDHKADTVQHFGAGDGTGIDIHDGALFVSSATTVYRYRFDGNALVPPATPEIIVDDLPRGGFGNRPLAFDDHGGLFIGMGGAGNTCNQTSGPGAKGKSPCPDLLNRAGIWRFDAARAGQTHPRDGLRLATGIRDIVSLDFDPSSAALYAATQGRGGMAASFPQFYTAEDDAEGIADEVFRLDAGANLGWPYSYYDGRVSQRKLAPEYGGDGKTPAPPGFTAPLAALKPHSSPLDLTPARNARFPSAWRNGLFIALQGGLGPAPQNGFQVAFLPLGAKGRAGPVRVFADGFAGPPERQTAASAIYRPSSVAVGPDGALYILDTKVGRIWRVTYGR